MTRIADDLRDTWEFNFEILKKWYKFSGDNNRTVCVFRNNSTFISVRRFLCSTLNLTFETKFLFSLKSDTLAETGQSSACGS